MTELKDMFIKLEVVGSSITEKQFILSCSKQNPSHLQKAMRKMVMLVCALVGEKGNVVAAEVDDNTLRFTTPLCYSYSPSTWKFLLSLS